MTDQERKKRRHQQERIVAATVVVALSAALVGLAIYNHREGEAIREQMYVPREAQITPEVILLRNYVKVDTSRNNEIDGARWLEGVLRAGGVIPEIIESAPGRGNIYARIRGQRPGGALMLLHHIDVVPAEAKVWSQPPYGSVIHFNMLYGRGALDMKGIAICQLRAFLDVARSGRTPQHDIIFLGTADEEQGSTWGVQWLLANRPDIFDGVSYVLTEGGITEVVGEQINYFGIEVGTKQNVTVTLRADSRETLQRTRKALQPWFTYREPERISPELARFFRYLAPQRVAYRPLLEDIEKTVREGRFWRLPTGYRELAQNNVWCEAILRENGGWTMVTRLLNLPEEDPDRRIAWLKMKIAPFDVTLAKVVRKDGPAPTTSEQTPLFRLLEKEVRSVYGDVPFGTEILNRHVNDSRFLRRRGIACYGIWPFPVDFYQSESVHGVDERIRLDWFMQGVRLTQRVVSSYAFGEPTNG